jgi:hypothetical protein
MNENGLYVESNLQFLEVELKILRNKWNSQLRIL